MKVNEFKYQDQKIKYYTNKEMKEKYPEDEFVVLGEISNKIGEIKDKPVDDEQGTVIYVQPLETYQPPMYKKIGYIWNEKEQGYVLLKKNNIATLISYGLIAFLLITIIFFGIQHLTKPKLDSNAMPYESTIERTEDMDESRILVPGYNDWNMIAGNDEVYAPLYNPDGNPCYFQFSIILDETEKVLFETGLIPPGEAVTTVKLSRAFEEGEYPITVKVYSLSLNDVNQKLNVEEIKIKINALDE